MNEELRRYLDGEIPFDALPDEVRREAEAWEQIFAAAEVEAPAGDSPVMLENRVMAEIHGLPARRPLARALDWLLHPQPIRVSPLVAGFATAAIATLILLPMTDRTAPAPTVAPPTAETVVYVEFRLEAPGARSVSVGGDFDDWGGSYALVDPDEDGVWTGRMAIEPGLHRYMFLVDGSDWVTDPTAERYADDGFGNRNAVLAVAMPAT